MSHYSLTLNQEKTPSDSRLQQNTFKITGFDGTHVAGKISFGKFYLFQTTESILVV